MLGFPDAVGASPTAISNFSSWLSQSTFGAGDARADQGAARRDRGGGETRLVDFVIYRSFGMHLADLVGYLTHPETYVNSSAAPASLGAGTSQSLDAVMGLTVDGVASLHRSVKLSRRLGRVPCCARW